MKTRPITQLLGVLALSTLSLMASNASAGWDHHERVYYSHMDRHHQHSQRAAQAINARQDRQMERILAGKRSGQLTRAEFRELMHEQRHIRRMERHFREDGHISQREYRHLDHALDRASRNIRYERHDRQDRFASNAMRHVY